MKTKCDYQGQKVILRADKAGVFFGTLNKRDGIDVQLLNCRKLFYWSGAAAIEQLALEGVKNSDKCQFTVVIPEMIITNPIQIIPCTKEAIANIENVAVWKN
jgi:hypothetical protein